MLTTPDKQELSALRASPPHNGLTCRVSAAHSDPDGLYAIVAGRIDQCTTLQAARVVWGLRNLQKCMHTVLEGENLNPLVSAQSASLLRRCWR